jgi:hypothetical protein
LTDSYNNGIMLDMNTQPPPNDPETRAFFQHLVQILRAGLPPVGDEHSGVSPDEALARRDAIAIAEVASLVPADSTEAELAVQSVVANAHAGYCLAQLNHHPALSQQAVALRKHFVRFAREARRALSVLLAVQAERHKRGPNNLPAWRMPPPTRERRGAGAPATGGVPVVAPPAPPPAPTAETQPAANRHSPEELRRMRESLAEWEADVMH